MVIIFLKNQVIFIVYKQRVVDTVPSSTVVKIDDMFCKKVTVHPVWSTRFILQGEGFKVLQGQVIFYIHHWASENPLRIFLTLASCTKL